VTLRSARPAAQPCTGWIRRSCADHGPWLLTSMCRVAETSWLGVRERVAAIASAEASHKVFGAALGHSLCYTRC
jgi:hypothetical protein